MTTFLLHVKSSNVVTLMSKQLLPRPEDPDSNPVTSNYIRYNIYEGEK